MGNKQGGLLTSGILPVAFGPLTSPVPPLPCSSMKAFPSFPFTHFSSFPIFLLPHLFPSPVFLLPHLFPPSPSPLFPFLIFSPSPSSPLPHFPPSPFSPSLPHFSPPYFFPFPPPFSPFPRGHCSPAEWMDGWTDSQQDAEPHLARTVLGTWQPLPPVQQLNQPQHRHLPLRCPDHLDEFLWGKREKVNLNHWLGKRHCSKAGIVRLTTGGLWLVSQRVRSS